MARAIKVRACSREVVALICMNGATCVQQFSGLLQRPQTMAPHVYLACRLTTTYDDVMTAGVVGLVTFLRAHLGLVIVQAMVEEAALTTRVLCTA